MKKILLVGIAIMMCAWLLGCGTKKQNGSNNGGKEYSVEELKAIITQAYEKVTDMPMVEVVEVDLSEVERVKMLTFLNNLDNVVAVVSGDAMIITVPYTLVLIELEKNADTEGLKKEIIDNVDLWKWICVGAEVAYVNSFDNVIFLLMGEKALADDVYAALEEVVGEFGKKLEKLGTN